ncbi:MAG TPA: DUF2779 domain-containing protein, partial [Anaerolineae bacterium]|nr:DUF2779 domain-containing protein [Anaerolineae bacterium]
MAVKLTSAVTLISTSTRPVSGKDSTVTCTIVSSVRYQILIHITLYTDPTALSTGKFQTIQVFALCPVFCLGVTAVFAVKSGIGNFSQETPMLTKTAYLTYSQCPKAFWLATNRPYLAAPPDPATQRRLRAGQEVDRRARDQFPNGRPVPYRPQPEEMAPLTTQAIAAGAATLFQATFTVDDLLVKADILARASDGWHLIEVKSTTSYKEKEHLPDVAFQLYVLQEAGLNVTQTSLMRLNSGCRAPDLSNLFTLDDVTAEANAFLPQIAADVTAMRRIAAQNAAPDVSVGRHCTRPYPCPFHEHCWQDVTGLTIYDIPRLSAKKERPLQESGVLYLADIPDDHPLTATQRKFVNFHVQRQINIDRDAIRREMAGLEYPLYFFDFETIDYAIPRFDGCKPYQQVPFQYSCHILHADGALVHQEYLHMDDGDPRRPLAESLLNHIGETGHLIAYNIPFERGVLNKLADHLPEYADRLRDVADRLWDQLPVFRQHYRDYRFGKSNSLKSVLPVITPELSYGALDVQNGTQAQVAWEEMVGEGDTAVKSQLADQLRAYCRLDTLAMV